MSIDDNNFYHFCDEYREENDRSFEDMTKADFKLIADLQNFHERKNLEKKAIHSNLLDISYENILTNELKRKSERSALRSMKHNFFLNLLRFDCVICIVIF